jgi:hypothetical protein
VAPLDVAQPLYDTLGDMNAAGSAAGNDSVGNQGKVDG